MSTGDLIIVGLCLWGVVCTLAFVPFCLRPAADAVRGVGGMGDALIAIAIAMGFVVAAITSAVSAAVLWSAP